MDIAIKRDRPRTVTSRKSIKYRESGWRVQEFELRSGEMVCRGAVLHMPGSLLVWLGESGTPRLEAAALGVPVPEAAAEGCARTAALLGPEAAAAAAAVQLARRLAAGLARPVYVCCGAAWDRHTMPSLQVALLAHLRTSSECI